MIIITNKSLWCFLASFYIDNSIYKHLCWCPPSQDTGAGDGKAGVQHPAVAGPLEDSPVVDVLRTLAMVHSLDPAPPRGGTVGHTPGIAQASPDICHQCNAPTQ